MVGEKFVYSVHLRDKLRYPGLHLLVDLKVLHLTRLEHLLDLVAVDFGIQ